MKLIEYGTGLGYGIIVVLEGKKGSGWAVFVKNLRETIGSPCVNRASVDSYKKKIS